MKKSCVFSVALAFVATSFLPTKVYAADCDDVVAALKILDDSYPRKLNDADLLNAAILGIEKKIERLKHQPIYLTPILSNSTKAKAIKQYYSDETEALRVTEGRLTKCDIEYEAASSMLQSLHDSHTFFMTPKTAKREREFDSGVINGGIGVSLICLDGNVYIDDVAAGSAAEKAGLKKFDKILKVGDWSAVSLPKERAAEKVVDRIIGPVGSEVVLTIKRPGIPSALKITAIRAKVNYPSVEFYEITASSVGYIKINDFLSNTFSMFSAALKQLLAKGVRSLSIDLRDNAGGNLKNVNKIVSMLIPPHTVLYREITRRRSIVFETTLKDKLNYASKATNNCNIPIVVLVNNDSASGSEILSSSIKERGRGMVIGEKTAGALEIAEDADFADNATMRHTISFVAMKMADGKFKPIEGIGVMPTITVKLRASDFDQGIDSQLNAAVKYLKKF